MIVLFAAQALQADINKWEPDCVDQSGQDHWVARHRNKPTPLCSKAQPLQPSTSQAAPGTLQMLPGDGVVEKWSKYPRCR